MVRNEKGMKLVITVVLAVAALVLLAILAVAFLPLKSVSAEVDQATGGQLGTVSVVIDMEMNIGSLEVNFAPLDGPAVRMHTSVKAHIGAMDPNDIMTTSLTSYPNGTECIVQATANVRQNLLYNSDVQVKNVLQIDPRYITSMHVVVGTGSVAIDTEGAGTLGDVSVEIKTGSISVDLTDGTAIAGNIDIRSNVGSVDVRCGNVTFENGMRNVRTMTGTGSVIVTCDIGSKLYDQVLWNIGTTTGSVELDLTIGTQLAAELIADSNLGSVSIPTIQNFQVIGQGDGHAKYQSMNYGSEDGIIFDVQVTGVGSIEAHLVQK